MSARTRYAPRFTLWPIRRVRSRSYVGGDVRKGWTLYLFGVLPILKLPRKD